MQIYISRSEKNGISKQQYLSCKYIICISVSIFWKFSLKAFRNKFFCNINIARLNNILQQRYGERGEKEEKEIFCVQKRRIYPLCREGEYIRRVEKKNIFCILKRQSTGKQKMGTGRFECKSYYYFRKRFLLILTLHHFHITLGFFCRPILYCGLACSYCDETLFSNAYFQHFKKHVSIANQW